MKQYVTTLAILLVLLLANSPVLRAQLKYLEPALFALNIASDARSSGMGGVGVASAADINSQRWNAAKYAFVEDLGGASVSYVPWLREVAKDVNLSYLSGYYKLPNNQSLSASIYFFSLGNITLLDDNANYIREVNPREFAVDLAYARRFGEFVSAALTFRYINLSRIDGGQGVFYTEQVNNFAVDISSYWQYPVKLWEDSEVAAGICISNIGTKVALSPEHSYFLPMNLRLGGRLSTYLNEASRLSVLADINKLLVPEDISYLDAPVTTAFFHSFKDGYTSIMTNFGLEYGYMDQFFARAGFFADAERMGGRQYLTFGAGARYRILQFDVSYLTTIKGQSGVMSNTLHLTLSLNFKGKSSKYTAKKSES